MYFRCLAETKAVQPVVTAMHTQLNLEVAAETSVNEAWERRGLAAIRINILDATREASRAAHRYRDAAAQNFERAYLGAATRNSRAKRDFYAAKERGILALHRVGAIRYAGASPQGMAVYDMVPEEGNVCTLRSIRRAWNGCLCLVIRAPCSSRRRKR